MMNLLEIDHRKEKDGSEMRTASAHARTRGRDHANKCASKYNRTSIG